MARFRLSRPARTDLALILTDSDQNWGGEAKRRYAATLVAAMRQVAANPGGPLTRDRSELQPGVRSFHLRHARVPDPMKVRRPVHILFYRAVGPEIVEIVRVIHERMEPTRQFGQDRDHPA
jgi:toxin ParE1/3/4